MLLRQVRKNKGSLKYYTTPRHLPDTVLCCHHKRYIFLGKVTKFEDVVAIENFWYSQYENDPGTK